MKCDVLIVGAGAAGLFCAMEAGKRGRHVLLIDKAAKAAEKIRISGGGRCNFTNLHTRPTNYISENPHFCKSALGRYSPQDFIALVESHHIAYHEKTLGQLFCDGSSKQIITMLLDECQHAGVEIMLQTELLQLEKDSEHFQATLSNNQQLITEAVVIATGGPSIPKMGATGWGYEIAEQFGHSIIPPQAALVPFTLDAHTLADLKPLAGVSLEVIAQCNGHSFREGMLFTHRGLSGPAILQISSYWNQGDTITVDLLPDINVVEALKERRENKSKATINSCLAEWLPKRLAGYLVDHYGWHGSVAELSNKKCEAIHQTLTQWQLTPNGTEGYRTAEVTRGGVNVNEISSRTFESKLVPGLYFIGEVLDVTGHLGGFNFQWAWASAYAAGMEV